MTSAEWSDGAAGPLLNLFDEITSPGTAWQERALCAEVDADMFFPEKGGDLHTPHRVCDLCAVRQECLDYAMDVESRPWVTGRYGIYGGLSPRGRARLAGEELPESEAA